MSTVAVLNDGQMQTVDYTKPDENGVVWPIPRDAKLDVQRHLRASLDYLGMPDVVVSKSGAFTMQELQNAKGQGVPYITVLRDSDVEEEMAIGRRVWIGAGNDPHLIDQGMVDPRTDLANDVKTATNTDTVQFFGTYSNVVVSVVISDKIASRADQLYIIVKLLMVAAWREFMNVGYLEVKRTGGSDSAELTINADTPNPVFHRTLTYSFKHPDLIATLEQAVNLVKQTLNFNEQDPTSEITADL